MRFPIHSDVLTDLLAAAERTNCQLELALFRVGIIGRAPLEEVREMLSGPEAALGSGFDAEGERIVTFWRGANLHAVLRADGTLHRIQRKPSSRAR